MLTMKIVSVNLLLEDVSTQLERVLTLALFLVER